MKASIRHVLAIPELHINDLKQRLVKSDAPLVQDEDGTFQDTISSSTAVPGSSNMNKSNKSTDVTKIHPQLDPNVKLQSLCVHPTEPILMYVVTYKKNDPLSQRIIVQNYATRQTIQSIEIQEVVQTWLGALLKQKSLKEKQAIIKTTCLNLGMIISLQFVDEQVIFHQSAGRTSPSKDVSSKSPYLIVQCRKEILLYSLMEENTGIATVEEINQNILNKSLPSSKPVTCCDSNLLLIGCSDGAMRFYSKHEHKVIKSVRGPNGRADPVVDIVFINPWKYEHTQMNNYSIDNGDKDYIIMKVATVCASGVAYLWELQLSFTETGRVGSIKIRPPLVKFDADRILSGAISHANIHSSGINAYKFKVRYEPERELLYWTVLTTISGVKKISTIVWDVTDNTIEIAMKSSSSELPLLYPSNIIRMPSSLILDHEASVCTGFAHPSFSDVAIMSAVVSNDVNLTIIGSRRGAPAKKKESEESIIYYQFPFNFLKNTTDDNLLSYLRFYDSRKISLVAIEIPFAQPSSIVVATTAGIMIIDLMDSNPLVTGSLHSMVPIGRGDYGIISTVNSSLYLSSIDFNLNTKARNPVGRMPLKRSKMVYDSSLNLQPFSASLGRPVRLPPKLLPSPSGDFICIFWQEEQMYEIVHVTSLVNISETSNMSPAVDSGNNVLSFAWVGDDDIFALLFPPEMIKEEEDSSDGFIVKRNPVNASNTVFNLETSEETSSAVDPAKLKPRVELKVLVKVNADCATEFSDSIAAATARFLGSITLRGRHPPTCLFGGPVLCVACLSDDPNTSKDGMSYIYSRNLDIDDSNLKATNFVSVGPALPYPDMVVWDEEGRLCCFVVGSRIAIYAATQSTFIFLGSASLGSRSDISPHIQSAKFINGVLYCSTQTSVQAIFIGDIDKNDRVCKIDSFLIASICKPTRPFPHSIDPTWQQNITLSSPSILGYFRGSLMISNSMGIQCLPLDQILIKIACLMSAGYKSKALMLMEHVHSSQRAKLKSYLFRWYGEVDTVPSSVN